MTSNYPPDYNQDIDNWEHPIDEVPEFDDSDDYRENLTMDAEDANTITGSIGEA